MNPPDLNIKSTATKLIKGDVRGVVEDVKIQIERTVGLVGVIIISLSAMLGSGLFVLPSFAAILMGEGIWLAFLLAASVVLPGAISKAELASGMPSSGGSYVYLERTYGPLVGTISGLGLWASFLLKASFALIGFTAYMYNITTYFDFELNTYVVSITALILITVVNIARFFNVSAELALKKTNKKFYRRFHHIERVVNNKKQNIEDLSLKELLNYWEEAKNEERSN